MNSFTIGCVQSLLVLTTTNNQCTFNNTFTTLRARGLSQHPAGTATLVVSIGSEGTIAVGGSLADSLPIATPTLLGVMYGAPPVNGYNSSLSLGYGAKAAGTWSIAIGNDILTKTKASSLCNVAVGSQNLQNLTTGSFNTAIGQNSSTNITTASNNVTLGYDAGGGGSGFVTSGNNIAISYSAANSANDAAATNNIYIGPNTATSATGVSNSIMLGSGATSGVSNEFMINNVHHLNIPALTTLADGTGILMKYGGANADWVEASGSTYNSVEKIDTIISTIQGQLPAEIIFTTTSTDPPDVTWTVLAGVNSITIIEASGSGAPGTPAIATSTSSIYQGGGGGGSGQVGNITVPVAEGMELTIILGAVSPPGNTVAYGTAVDINGITVIICNGANSNTSGMDGGNGATLFANVFCSYSCGGSGGMNSSGGGASGTGGSGSTSFFNGTASAEWGSGNSGNGGLNNNGALPLVLPGAGTQPSGVRGAGGEVLGSVFLSSYTSGHLGCGGCGGFGDGSGGNLIPPGSGGSGYVKLRLY